MTRTLCTLFFLAACTDTEAVDPAGRWDVTVTLGTGSCGATGVVAIQRTITGEHGSYAVSGGEPNTLYTAMIVCNANACSLDLTERYGTADYAATDTYRLMLHEDDTIDGSGQSFVSFPNNPSCSQAFSARGQITR